MNELTDRQILLAIDALRLVYHNSRASNPNFDGIDYEVLIGKFALELATRMGRPLDLKYE
jgi:hypothetical protein